MSLFKERSFITMQMLVESGEYEIREVERNVGGKYYEVFGMPFYFGGELKMVEELFPTNPKCGLFEELMKPPTRIDEALIKKAMSSIGLKIEQL